jgi:hypothetical protein
VSKLELTYSRNGRQVMVLVTENGKRVGSFVLKPTTWELLKAKLDWLSPGEEPGDVLVTEAIQFTRVVGGAAPKGEGRAE